MYIILWRGEIFKHVEMSRILADVNIHKRPSFKGRSRFSAYWGYTGYFFIFHGAIRFPAVTLRSVRDPAPIFLSNTQSSCLTPPYPGWGVTLWGSSFYSRSGTNKKPASNRICDWREVSPQVVDKNKQLYSLLNFTAKRGVQGGWTFHVAGLLTK